MKATNEPFLHTYSGNELEDRMLEEKEEGERLKSGEWPSYYSSKVHVDLVHYLPEVVCLSESMDKFNKDDYQLRLSLHAGATVKEVIELMKFLLDELEKRGGDELVGETPSDQSELGNYA